MSFVHHVWLGNRFEIRQMSDYDCGMNVFRLRNVWCKRNEKRTENELLQAPNTDNEDQTKRIKRSTMVDDYLDTFVFIVSFVCHN